MAKVESNTSAGDIVVLAVPAATALGILVEADREGHAAVVRSWERLPNGKFGPVQKHGGVHIGDVVMSINDTAVTQLPFSDVSNMLNDQAAKTVKFISGAEHYRRKRGKVRPETKETKTPFLSMVRKGRVNSLLPPNLLNMK